MKALMDYLGIKVVVMGWEPDHSGLTYSLSCGAHHVVSRYPTEYRSVFRIYLKVGEARCGLSVFYNRQPLKDSA